MLQSGRGLLDWLKHLNPTSARYVRPRLKINNKHSSTQMTVVILKEGSEVSTDSNYRSDTKGRSYGNVKPELCFRVDATQGGLRTLYVLADPLRPCGPITSLRTHYVLADPLRPYGPITSLRTHYVLADPLRPYGPFTSLRTHYVLTDPLRPCGPFTSLRTHYVLADPLRPYRPITSLRTHYVLADPLRPCGPITSLRTPLGCDWSANCTRCNETDVSSSFDANPTPGLNENRINKQLDNGQPGIASGGGSNNNANYNKVSRIEY